MDTLACKEAAIPPISTKYSTGTSLSICNTTCPFLPSNNKVSAFLISSLLTTFSLTEYRRSLVTVTVTSCMMMSEVSLDGKLTGKPDGVIKEEVSIKKISNRKITSVMDDMLNTDSILFFVCKAITFSPVKGQ